MRLSNLRSCHLTLQSISEFYAAVTRNRMMPTADAAQVARDLIDVFRTVTASATAIPTALGNAATGRASYRDALLVASAAEAGCTAILTEDLDNGDILPGVRILTPFAGTALAPDAAALPGKG